MDNKTIANATWPRALGVIGVGLLIASLSIKEIYFDRNALTCIAIGLVGIALSNAAGMRSILTHKVVNGRLYEVSGSKFVWTPIAIIFSVASAGFLLAALYFIIRQ